MKKAQDQNGEEQLIIEGWADLTSTRNQDLYNFWVSETKESQTRKWRKTLSEEEAQTVRGWDHQIS